MLKEFVLARNGDMSLEQEGNTPLMSSLIVKSIFAPILCSCVKRTRMASSGGYRLFECR